MEADGIGGGRRGGYTLNEPERYDIATVRSHERKKASGIGGDREKKDTPPNTPARTISPRFGILNERRRPEAEMIDPKWHTSIPKTPHYFTTVRLSSRSGASGTDDEGKVGTC